ncbi:mast cell protease 8-like isoform X2 [Nelusetta ayraudi]|uniref:mast cell protease 8-like isoform X2 n=1 Tax=Nelusetta ayraudi TaxID=303726 RepID=UPI003F7070A3
METKIKLKPQCCSLSNVTPHTTDSLLSGTMRPSLKLLLLLLCGLALSVHGGEIINGVKVSDSQMLYMASVQNARHKHICGGFLISEDIVVTAAHCYDKVPTSVVLGTHNLKRIDKTMRYAVKMKCKHKSYKNLITGNDIMLLKLSEKVQRKNKRVKTIELPKTEVTIKPTDKCLVAGWGITKHGGSSVTKLQKVNVRYMNLDQCKEKWGRLPDTVMCAGGFTADGKGFCQGDSGGPLVCNGKPVGIVSFNRKGSDNKGNCTYPNFPNVYTNLSKYIQWIEETSKKREC